MSRRQGFPAGGWHVEPGARSVIMKAQPPPFRPFSLNYLVSAILHTAFCFIYCQIDEDITKKWATYVI